MLAMRLAHAVDEGDTDFSRLGVALGKSWVCKRTPAMVAEAMECLGGAGYVEENGLARLYREAPLNSIWEGSGNVNALDVLRAMVREPASVAALGKELALVRGHDRALDAAIDEVEGYAALAARETRPGRRGGSSSGWRSPCRRRCSSSTPPRPCPRRSSRAGCAPSTAGCSGRSPPTSGRPGWRDPRPRAPGAAAGRDCTPSHPSN